MRKTDEDLVTLNYLKEISACGDDEGDTKGIAYWLTLPKERNSLKWLLQHAIDSHEMSVKRDANWLLCHMLSRKNCLRYVIHAAELVLCIYEDEHRSDDKPRKAIEAAKAVLEKDSEANMKLAYSAYYDAYCASNASAKAADVAYNSDSDNSTANAINYTNASNSANSASSSACVAHSESVPSAINAIFYSVHSVYFSDGRKELMDKCLSFALTLINLKEKKVIFTHLKNGFVS